MTTSETDDSFGPSTDPKTVPPREGVKTILGENVQTDLLLYLTRVDRVVTASDIVRALDGHDAARIADEMETLARVNALVGVSPGCYRLTAQPVGLELRELIEVCAEKTREVQHLTPLAECVYSGV